MTGWLFDDPDAPSSAEQRALEELGAAIPPLIRFGTSSWTYPGWRGLVYHREYPARGGAAAMLEEYGRFPLFGTVGIDSTFYAPPTPETLQSYAKNLPPGFPCVAKVWDRVTIHTFAGAREPGRAGQRNPDFLNPAIFLEAVYQPAQEFFADHQGPFVFEFQQIPRVGGLTPEEFAERLDEFFSELPAEGKYAVELRNEEFLTPMYFAVLREHGVAHLFNSWTRMPSVGEQLDLPGSITGSFILARALLRPGRTYSQAVNRLAPYDRIQDPNPAVRNDLARLALTALQTGLPAYVLVNNRLEGCAPETIAAVARLLQEARGG